MYWHRYSDILIKNTILQKSNLQSFSHAISQNNYYLPPRSITSGSRGEDYQLFATESKTDWLRLKQPVDYVKQLQSYSLLKSFFYLYDRRN